MKIGICGQMCSGKTTIANYIISQDNSYHITSFAKKLKEIAKDLFNMQGKDRKLLIDIGKKMREIDENVWVNYTIKECKNHENIIIDDIRYLNEFTKLKEGGWITIKLVIDRDLQLERLKKTYPDTWEKHYKYIQDNSEKTNEISDDLFHKVININKTNQDFIFKKIYDIIKNKN